ncbi:GNAT family N-acetyltransferase [Microbulbifer thermotolerans]|nr:GNAT family N-acetyltransferase [Microbulbifer thermotolerans]MCX2779173.1 GNAT family N-acetyltransferase [Microbulbifer thermotolerans]MCX2803597.1 GNAT family N-acetyltransferase [Microbulbifer thermotolerans]MCX2840779.1 GNAT family N-acetyltransferase [Microbulbifer thermotolerans]
MKTNAVMIPLQTQRLTLRQLTQEDAPLMLAVLNDPDFLRNVGDRGVRTEADARRYIADGIMAMYRRRGFGLYKVELKDGTPLGVCGLLKREGLGAPDIGFALLPEYRRQGYTLEAARAVMRYARDVIGLTRIVAIALPNNTPSLRLLEKLGLRPEGIIRLPGEDEDLLLMVWENQE